MEYQPFIIAMFHVALLSFFLGVGKLIRLRFQILQYLLLPAAAIGGIVAILVSPFTWANYLTFPQIIQDIYGNFGEISIFLLNFVFAGMFIGRKIPNPRRSFRKAGPQIIHGQLLSWGQLMLPSLAMILIINRFYDLPDAFGTLIPIGFDGGATVAVGYTSTFKELGWYPEGVQLGIAAGVMGIIGGCILGVGIINWLVRRDQTKIADKPEDIPDYIRRGLYREEDFESAGNLTTVPQAIEPIALVFCLFGVTMFGGWGFITALGMIPGGIGQFFSFAPLFPFAMLCGMLLQGIISKLGYGHIVDRGLTKRLQNLALEFCILSVFASLDIPLVLQSSIPMALIIAAGIIWTLFIALSVAPLIMPDYWAERMLVDYGQAMGNVPIGMLLLRIVDPQFETPVLEHFSYRHAFHAPIMFSLLAFMPIVAQMWGIEFIFLLSLGVIILNCILAKMLGYWGQGRSLVSRLARAAKQKGERFSLFV
ncbi:sodium/glutamate symporter [Halarsenatibacter silvermanii]|uniref:Glutamate:Na+ symporter, ESS family n=1 Tax=Halarsenatibacter silvermanii TaxID=321763 RepID=A0A1G9PFN9_9FIRM|nr:sodium/glutamate symporter [Halarsenatibacter silvermanii]SDL97578.1 glutamate:Na+ symporter, ESS family [Halarsenatibacter silvermanii]